MSAAPPETAFLPYRTDDSVFVIAVSVVHQPFGFPNAVEQRAIAFGGCRLRC